jgi:hypothetical protein
MKHISLGAAKQQPASYVPPVCDGRTSNLKSGRWIGYQEHLSEVA